MGARGCLAHIEVAGVTLGIGVGVWMAAASPSCWEKLWEVGRSFELCRRKSCKYIYIFLINLLPSLFFFLSLFIYLFMAVLGLRFCARAFSSCGRRGPLFIVVHGPLTIAASLVAEHRLQTRRLSSCGSRAQLLRGMWDPPRPGLEPVSPALAGRFSTTAPPGKPRKSIFTCCGNYKKYNISLEVFKCFDLTGEFRFIMR